MSFRKKLGTLALCALAGVIVAGSVLCLLPVPGASELPASDRPNAAREHNAAAWGFSDSEINSGRHTQYREADQTVESPYTVDGYTLRLQSDTLQVWVMEGTAKLRVVDRRSGYVWGLREDEKPDTLNKSWYAMASSLCALDYYNEKNSEERVATESKEVSLRYTWEKDRFQCAIDMKDQGFRLTVEVRLDGSSLHCGVVEGSVEEYGDCKIKSLYFLPFLGSTYADTVDGYFLVPDGCGALLRFQKPSPYNSALEGRVYGPDPGIDSLAVAGNLLASRDNDYLVTENRMTLPVYGIVHGDGQHGVLAIIDGGQEQAFITANAAGVVTDYNWISTRFAYRTSYMKPVNKSGTGVYTAQENRNDITPSMEYVFMTEDDATYSAMAVYYRQRLEQEGKLPDAQTQEQIPLWLSILGAEIKKGVLFNTTEVLTTVEQAQSITEALQSAGISNLSACYYGWEKGGLNGADYGELRLDSRLGREDALRAWQADLEQNGGELSLYRNLGQANKDQITLRQESAMNISSAYAHYSVDNKALMYPDSYVVKVAEAENNLEALRSRWAGWDFALDNIGIDPHSDYDRTQPMTRRETMEHYSALVSADAKSAVFQPSMYQWGGVSSYLDIPMTNSQYLFETDTVPFLQIILKNHIPYFAPYCNLGFYSENAMLKMVEYGAYPAFVVAQAQSYMLEDTPLSEMFSVCFDDWQESIVEQYSYLASALNAVEGEEITEHRMVAPGLARVSYENNIQIYVNYNAENVTIGDITVPARSYLVEGGQR